MFENWTHLSFTLSHFRISLHPTQIDYLLYTYTHLYNCCKTITLFIIPNISHLPSNTFPNYNINIIKNHKNKTKSTNSQRKHKTSHNIYSTITILTSPSNGWDPSHSWSEVTQMPPITDHYTDQSHLFHHIKSQPFIHFFFLIYNLQKFHSFSHTLCYWKTKVN